MSLDLNKARKCLADFDFPKLLFYPSPDGIGRTLTVKRTDLRTKLDGLIPHLCGLVEEEVAHILTIFPLVADLVKDVARNARDIERGWIKRRQCTTASRTRNWISSSITI